MLRQSIARSVRPLASSSFFTNSARVSAARATQQASTSETQKTAFAPRAPGKGMTPLAAGMPQLIPFFFVNETIFGFAMIGGLIYFASKYFLPRQVRTCASRMFIAKL